MLKALIIVAVILAFLSYVYAIAVYMGWAEDTPGGADAKFWIPFYALFHNAFKSAAKNPVTPRPSEPVPAPDVDHQYTGSETDLPADTGECQTETSPKDPMTDDTKPGESVAEDQIVDGDADPKNS